jgi:hypothetical protein
MYTPSTNCEINPERDMTWEKSSKISDAEQMSRLEVSNVGANIYR